MCSAPEKQPYRCPPVCVASVTRAHVVIAFSWEKGHGREIQKPSCIHPWGCGFFFFFKAFFLFLKALQNAVQYNFLWKLSVEMLGILPSNMVAMSLF